jgi:hypothetical protein
MVEANYLTQNRAAGLARGPQPGRPALREASKKAGWLAYSYTN